MATKLVQSPILPSHVALPCYTGKNIINLQGLVRRVPLASNISAADECQYGLRSTFAAKVAENTAGLMGDDTIVQKKAELYQSLEGINRGLFGIPSAKRFEIEDLAKQLEIHNPTPDPTRYLGKVAGCWKLIYSTITILGSKRTKLGLRDFISLDEIFQTIDVAKSKAVNEIKFSSRGLNLLNGKLTIEAYFKIASNSRVEITYDSSTITPDQLMKLFRKNYVVLLNIFNPEGWLEITYVDDTMRIGRDDKGNIFILERCP